MLSQTVCLETSYVPEVYDKLPHSHDVFSSLQDLKESIQELLKVISKHNLGDFIGLNLLHKHFELEKEERLIERKQEDCIYIEPKKNYNEKELIPYIWKLGEKSLNQNENVFYPVEFTKADNNQRKILSVIMDNKDFLKELGDKLKELNLCSTLGITLNHREDFMRLSGSTIEYTHYDNRILLVISSQTKLQDPLFLELYNSFEGNVETNQTSWFTNEKFIRDCSHSQPNPTIPIPGPCNLS